MDTFSGSIINFSRIPRNSKTAWSCWWCCPRAAACGGHPCRSPAGKCPFNAVKLGMCADVLDGLIHGAVGQPPKEPCCSLISGLADLEAAVCVCLAINANVLGVAVDLSLLVNYCGRSVPKGFQCA
ncbi:hypothetical protein BS78_10G003200 [Paspalum vaginatum]|nr:hypothetical protein BS78_10G003200 [Paspalum vaginatum]